MSLKTLVVNFQPLPITGLDTITGTKSPLQTSLTVLDLSYTGIGGILSASLASALPNLTELHLDDNVFSTLPTSANGVFFPPKVSVMSMRGNSAMEGGITAQECDAFGQAEATRCDFSGTQITLASGVSTSEGGCSVCLFR